jgi:hypothetical protein
MTSVPARKQDDDDVLIEEMFTAFKYAAPSMTLLTVRAFRAVLIFFATLYLARMLPTWEGQTFGSPRFPAPT